MSNYHMRPIRRARTQFCPHGIIQNVIGLVALGFLPAQAVVEKVPLPFDLPSGGAPSFPITDDALEGSFKRKPHERMVGHDDHDSDIPQTALHPVSGSFQENLGHARLGEWAQIAV